MARRNEQTVIVAVIVFVAFQDPTDMILRSVGAEEPRL